MTQVDPKVDVFIKLQLALDDLRREKMRALYGRALLYNLGAALVMPDDIILRIVNGARAHKLRTLEDLQRETVYWDMVEDMREDVLRIVASIIPQTSEPQDSRAPLREISGDVDDSMNAVTAAVSHLKVNDVDGLSEKVAES
ncbi:hypothetical protein C2E23DRAFT_851964 [Lenzites betulinus]|nr:hypothetical protein C2E23DRAFT_851964 [Lenzites betulinus]